MGLVKAIPVLKYYYRPSLRKIRIKANCAWKWNFKLFFWILLFLILLMKNINIRKQLW